MIMNKIKEVISFIFAFSIFAFIIYGMVRCSEDEDTRREYRRQYGIEHPVYYEISFVDGYKDTIAVWTSPSGGDYIEMYDNRGAFSDGKVVLSYTPYKKYTRTDCISCNEINLYNVLRYRKLRSK